MEKAVSVGLDAMEVWYGEFSPEQTRLAKDIAEEFGLLPSGGSDFHGGNKPGLDLGVGRGKLQVPDFCLELLARRRKEKRK